MSRQTQHFRDVMDKAAQLGYEYKGKNKHLKFFHPVSRQTVVVSGTPKGMWATSMAIRDLEKFSRTMKVA